jgi:hypothetical protein
MQNSKIIIEKKLQQIKKQEKKTTFERVRIIFNKTKSVLSLKNFSEPKEKVQTLTKTLTSKILKPANNYPSDDDSIRISNRANNENHSFNSSGSSHYLLHLNSQKLLNSFHDLDLSFHEEKNLSSARKSLSSSKDSLGEIHPVLIIQQSYARVTAVGSATALVAIKNGQELRVANIGDSGFLLIRFSQDNEPYIAHKSKEQQHAFNIPY